MRLEERQHLNKRPIRLKIIGWIDPMGYQVVEMSVIYRGHRYSVAHAFQGSKDEAPFIMNGLRRSWRKLREGLRRTMHGDNFRERWAIERAKRDSLRTWEKLEGALVPFTQYGYARERFQRNMERMLGPTPPYTGHDYVRRELGTEGAGDFERRLGQITREP